LRDVELVSSDRPPVVALTGATGFIGRPLLRELPRRGYRIRVLLRRPSVLPPECSGAVIGDLTKPYNMSEALAGVDAVIHSAGLAHTMSGRPEDDYRALNTEATVRLARAAERAGAKRFVFLSSIRAQCGASADCVLTEETAPNPTDAYGRSKLAAEEGLSGTGLDWAALRLTLVYGPGVQGNMARLLRLARSPYPLPLAALKAQRSLLSLDNLVEAIDTVLTTPQELRRPLIAADPEPISVAGMIAAMRQGLGRRPGLFPVPPSLIEAALRARGQAWSSEALMRPLVVDPANLMQLGWRPATATPEALALLMRAPAEQGEAA
jgi:nucleoside-diphosphate-sugar epimerase